MKQNWVRFAILLILISGLPLEAKKKKASSAKKPAVTRSAAQKSAKSARLVKSAKSTKVAKGTKSARSQEKTAGRRTSLARGRNSRKRTVIARQPAPPAIPSSDRFREIQEALAQKGYLTTPPTNVWDQNAQDALRKFQTDQNLSVSGKISSRSLIALGLGSPTAAAPAASATPVPPKP